MLKPTRKLYPKGGNRRRRPIEVEIMLRIYFMQQWYQLSDPAIEDSLYNVEAMRSFALVRFDEIPGDNTIYRFRHFLEKHALTEKLFEVTEQCLSTYGLILSERTIVDASIVSAPSSTKNQRHQRNSDMEQVRKENQWYFGKKMYVGSDTQERIHSVVVTDASVHNATVTGDLIHGEERILYGNKAYVSAERKEKYETTGVTWRTNRKASRGKRLNGADLSFNRKSNRSRARVEHAFGVVKSIRGYRKVRYKGLAKSVSQVFALSTLSNLYMARKEMAAI